jgi:drug/metabolite transporter (DMT)-like permease
VNAALLSVTIPVFTAAIAVILGHERPSWRLGIGLATSIAGVVWLTGVGKVDMGALVILANCVSYSLYIVLSRATIQRLGTLTVVTWIFAWGAILFAPLGMPDLLAGVASWTARGWTLLAYIVAMPTIVAYLCNAWALERSSPTLVSIYIYVQPVLAAVLAWLQLGSAVSERLALAAVITAAGVTIVATRRNAVPVPMEE